MNKKGIVILSLAALGFLIAVSVFYGRPPASQQRFLGELEVDIFNTYIGAEKALLYIDLIAEYSWKEARGNIAGSEGKSDENLLADFKGNFGKRLEGFNRAYNRSLKIEDYEFSIDGEKIKGITEKELNFTTTRIDYKFKPNFKYPLDESV